MPLMTYALKNNKLIHVDDVESGIACGCICPACGSNLIARKGEINSHHFAHSSSSECKGGYETSLHLLAKEILSETGEILLPPIKLIDECNATNACLIGKHRIKKIDNVYTEKRTGDIIPDLILEKGKRELIVEIYVTHKVDDAKLQKIKDLGISAIEIDLSKTDKSISKQQLKDLLLNNVENKRWLYNSKAAKKFAEICEDSEKKPVISRGFANHVDFCPIEARTWKGKRYTNLPYANLIDDCFDCQYLIKYYDDGINEYIICNGKNKTIDKIIKNKGEN
ncbi:MAG: hypothetical protein IKS03_06550 [Ruminococcus sp.]|nr:hypothetical protein [Ruminococcus sp.]